MDCNKGAGGPTSITVRFDDADGGGVRPFTSLAAAMAYAERQAARIGVGPVAVFRRAGDGRLLRRPIIRGVQAPWFEVKERSRAWG